MHHFGLPSARLLLVGLLAAQLTLGLACSPASPVDVGTDYAPQDIDRITQSPSTSPPDAGDPGGFEPLVQPNASPLCQDQFSACGGLLAGTWVVMDTCNQEVTNSKALQIWGQAVMNLDTTACWDAVESVKSSWTGDLVFDQGVATDKRIRSDTVEMTLTRECLNATFNVTIKAEKMASVCSTLTNTMQNCTSVDGACHCSSRRENMADIAGTYGVLGTYVSIGTPNGGHDFFDYCVKGDMLFWREPASLRHVVLERSGPATAAVDPEGLR